LRARVARPEAGLAGARPPSGRVHGDGNSCSGVPRGCPRWPAATARLPGGCRVAAVRCG